MPYNMYSHTVLSVKMHAVQLVPIHCVQGLFSYCLSEIVKFTFKNIFLLKFVINCAPKCVFCYYYVQMQVC